MIKLKDSCNQILERLEYPHCERCERSDRYKFSFHHIVYRSEAPKHPNLHHPDNLIHVCDYCHNYFHESKARRIYLINERRLFKLFPKILQKYDNS